MILVVSGHPGVQEFARRQPHERLSIITVDSWAQAVPYVPDAEKVFVGQRIPDFPRALEWARGGVPGGAELVVWIERDYPAVDLETSERVAIWRGEIDQQTLERWWADQSHGKFSLERLWAVVSLFPYPDPRPLFDDVTHRAQTKFGQGGGWIDLDWQHADLSLAWESPRVDQPDYPFTLLRPRAAGRCLLIPAPPPWVPGTRTPTAAQVDSLLALRWPWQGWYLGAQVALPATVAVLARVPVIVLWRSQTTPSQVVRRTEDFLKLYSASTRLVVLQAESLNWLGDDPEPGSQGVRKQFAGTSAHFRKLFARGRKK